MNVLCCWWEMCRQCSDLADVSPEAAQLRLRRVSWLEFTCVHWPHQHHQHSSPDNGTQSSSHCLVTTGAPHHHQSQSSMTGQEKVGKKQGSKAPTRSGILRRYALNLVVLLTTGKHSSKRNRQEFWMFGFKNITHSSFQSNLLLWFIKAPQFSIYVVAM